MKHAVEHKVSHREWDEVTFEPGWFFANHKRFEDDEGFNWDFNPTFVFENGQVYADESWSVDNGRVSTSSHPSGVMDWNEERQTYVKHFHFSETVLGQLTAVTMTLDDKVRAVIAAADEDSE